MNNAAKCGIGILAMLWLFTASGCGTGFTMMASEGFDKQVAAAKASGKDPKAIPKPSAPTPFPLPHIYSGTILDLTAFSISFFGLFSGDPFLFYASAAILPASVVDLPFSFAADTMLLPLTVYKQVVYGNITARKSRPAVPEKVSKKKEKPSSPPLVHYEEPILVPVYPAPKSSAFGAIPVHPSIQKPPEEKSAGKNRTIGK